MLHYALISLLDAAGDMHASGLPLLRLQQPSLTDTAFATEIKFSRLAPKVKENPTSAQCT
jgi:hypothetical protein